MRLDGMIINGVKYVVAKTKCCDCTECAFFKKRKRGCPLIEWLDLDQCPLQCGQVFKKEEA